MESRVLIFGGPASPRLGAEICELLDLPPARYESRRFPDGEIQVEVEESVRGVDVYLVQSTSPPVEQRLMELLLLADACRRAGAARLTAVIPYFGYARQDRRTGRRALGGRVAADIVGRAGFDRLMLIDAHTPAIEGFFDVPIEHLTAVPLLAQAAASSLRENSIVVAPDLGAVKRARAYATLLHRPMAIVHKSRLNGDSVEAHAVIGEVRGRVPLIVDDMLSTGGTIEAAVNALRDAGAIEPVTVAVTHALFVGHARDVLRHLAIDRLIAGNTVEVEPHAAPHLHRVSVAPLLATAIQRTHKGESLADLRVSA